MGSVQAAAPSSATDGAFVNVWHASRLSKLSRVTPAPIPVAVHSPGVSQSTLIDGRWRVLDLIGAGGGGRVWRVREEGTGQIAALKLIQVTTAMHRLRVKREIQALRSLSVQGVVQLIDTGEFLGQPYLVMEYIDGAPFPGRSAGTAWKDIVDVAIRLAEILAQVHGANVMHRDLKPENVLVTVDRQVHLLDFGLARGGALDPTITAGEALMGTARYLAPEQLLGIRIDHRADLYAFGVMLYEALSGTQLYSNAAANSRMLRRTTPQAPPLGPLAPTAPTALVELVHALLRTEPHERPENALVVLKALRGVASGTAPPPPTLVPLIGREAVLGRVLDHARLGRAFDVWGQPGTGKTRLLREVCAQLTREGNTVFWAEPADRPFRSLVPLLGALPTTAGATGEMYERLRSRVASGTIVIADDHHALDSSSRMLLARARDEGAILRAVEAPDAALLLPLPEVALRSLFHGPDRVLHLREDGAAELFRRTVGLPLAIARELDAWVTTGLARWDDRRVRIDRQAIEKLAVGVAFVGRDVSPVGVSGSAARPELSEHLVDELVWIALAMGALTARTLAIAMGVPEWEVEIDAEELEILGAVRRARDGRLEAAFSPPELFQLEEDEAGRRHRAIASALAPGDPHRLRQWVILEAGDEAVAELAVRSEALLAAGKGATALALCLGTWQALRPVLRPEQADEVLRYLAYAALDPLPHAQLRSAIAALRESGRDRSVTVALVAEARLLIEVGQFAAASALVRALPRFIDLRIEERRITVRVVAAIEGGVEDPRPLLDAAARPGGGVAPARLALWEGTLLYWQRRYGEAITKDQLALELADTPQLRLNALTSLASASMDNWEFGRAIEFGMQLVRESAALRQVGMETFGWSLLYSCYYMMEDDSEPDPDWEWVSGLVGTNLRHAVAMLTHAGRHWRGGKIEDGKRLARLSADLHLSAGRAEYALVPTALWLVCGGGGQAELAAAIPEALACARPIESLQTCCLLRWITGPRPDLDARIRDLVHELHPAPFQGRYGLLSYDEMHLP